MIWIGKLVSNNKILIQASSKERDSRPLFLFQSSPQVKDLNDSHMAFPRILIGPLYHPSAFNAFNYQEKWLIMSDVGPQLLPQLLPQFYRSTTLTLSLMTYLVSKLWQMLWF